MQPLLTKITSREAVIAICGLGYVGLPLALRFSEAGFKVIGLDTDAAKAAKLTAGQSYIERIAHSQIQDANAAGFVATTDYAQTARADALLICVPTPLGKHNDPDLQYVRATADAIMPHLKRGALLVLESTTYPGTTEEELLPRLQSRGLVVGEDAFLGYSPEREDPGNPDYHTRNIPKIVSGCTVECLQVTAALYGEVIDRVVRVSSMRAAEMTKLLENIYRAVNIGLVNELKLITEAMGVDIYEVIDAAATKPFGFTPFYPGPGTGGHCLPIDPFYLAWKAKEYGVAAKFIELTGEVNAAMPAHYAARATAMLNRDGKSVRDAKVLILGVAYKKNVDDMRESPALKIMQLLREKGAQVRYCDPHVPELENLRGYDFSLQSAELSAEILRDADLAILCTDHDAFDYRLIAKHAKLLLDTRGRMRGSFIS